MADNKAVTVQEKNITEKTLERIKTLEKSGDLTFPQNYNYGNAIKSAYLILSETKDKSGKPVLQTCSQASIANALLDMTIQGLSPAKKQCYFIPYGNQLQLSKSYLGNIAATKRLKGVKNVYANCIYEKDEFSYTIDLETGLKKITKHEQSFENIDLNKIKGAYAVVVMEDGNNYVEVMNINQIKNAWNMGAAKGGSKAHTNFSDEMAKKTVINRACKNFVNTSDDSDILIESINRTNEYREEDIIENVQAEVKEEIKENANKEVLDIPFAEEPTQEVVEAEVVSEEEFNEAGF
ncbi:recombinase RecT [Clostridium culturomicium]|uniref:recombinase RecT n=1 Tax=Clostridium culturomicium TaxID=1499683 RepID=UPI0038573DD3